MRWQCQYFDGRGRRCENKATHRLHFADDHPFDHQDVCISHKDMYKFVAWVQILEEKEESNAETV